VFCIMECMCADAIAQERSWRVEPAAHHGWLVASNAEAGALNFLAAIIRYMSCNRSMITAEASAVHTTSKSSANWGSVPQTVTRGSNFPRVAPP
jgi:hypothetical protein